MMKFCILSLLLVLKGMKAQVLPSRYLYQEQSESVNGSSPTGHCSNIAISSGLTTCTQPATSVLFDGDIPTLTGLDGDMWASQLLTLQATHSTRRDIVFDFTSTPNYSRVEGVELVMFNCPKWGIAVQTIAFLTSASVSESGSLLTILNHPIVSCVSLVRVCIPQGTTDPVITLQFVPPPGSNWVHLAGVKFYGNAGRCSENRTTSIDQPPTTRALDSTGSPTESNSTTTTTIDTAESNFEVATTGSETCLSCSSTPKILASVLTVVVLAILVTAILVMVLIAVCNYHPKFTLEVAETGAQTGGEDHVYEDMSENEINVGMESDPGYIFMNIGVGGENSLKLKQDPEEGSMFQVQKNEAYAAHINDD